MNRRFHINPFVNEPENPGPTSDNGPDDSPGSTPSPKKSKRSVQKKVVSVRIGDVDGSRSKGEGYPPSDSWAWRKYGQKPIKGSPYPRGYYRCSSSKGCPARKQVERSRVDPTTLVITYSCEHNHPFPTTKHNPTPAAKTAATTAAGDGGATTFSAFPPEDFAVFANQRDLEPDDKFAELGDDSLLTPDEFWFSDVASASPTVLESPIFLGNGSADDDVAMMFMMGEEDESLFADLGELPECSVVFRRSVLEQDEHRRRCNVDAPWCGSTG